MAPRRHPPAPCQAAQTRTLRSPQVEVTCHVEAVYRDERRAGWVIAYRPHVGKGLGQLYRCYIDDLDPQVVVL